MPTREQLIADLLLYGCDPDALIDLTVEELCELRNQLARQLMRPGGLR